MFGKAKDLQAKLEQCEQEKQMLSQHNAEMSLELEEYRKKSEAIVKALTEAQKVAERVIQEAEAKREEIVLSAQEERSRIESEGE